MSTTNTTASSPAANRSVTGAGTGSGTAIVRHFAADGARVTTSAQWVVRLARLAKELGNSVLPLQLDGTAGAEG